MKKFKKLITMTLAAVMAVSTIGIGAFAADESQIDYSVYDSDMQYIPEDAAMIAAYNESVLKSRAEIYPEWNWSRGIFSLTTHDSSGIVPQYYFVPTANYIYFNVEVTESSKTPHLAVNVYNDDGTLGYVGSYNITSIGNNSYAWNNYKRALNKGTKYTFALLNSTRWSYASIDIYNQSL